MKRERQLKAVSANGAGWVTPTSGMTLGLQLHNYQITQLPNRAAPQCPWFHSAHGGVVVMVRARLFFQLALHRPNVVRRFLPWIHVHHPAENMRQEGSAGSGAGFRS